MASKTTTRSLQLITRRAQRDCSCASTSIAPIRHFSSSASRLDLPYEVDQAERPRWSYTPERMKAPFPARPRNPDMAWECNNDPVKLDQFYEKFLGRGGDSVLSEEIKWLAITHKSFDQGRRGFNDRLAFFGMSSIPILPYFLSPFFSSYQIMSKIFTNNRRPPHSQPPSNPLPLALPALYCHAISP
jgi:large subunit ribosomal protein L15